jgi:hypothetical protein
VLHNQWLYLLSLGVAYVGAFVLVDRSWLMPMPMRVIQTVLTIWFLFAVIHAVSP